MTFPRDYTNDERFYQLFTHSRCLVLAGPAFFNYSVIIGSTNQLIFPVHYPSHSRPNTIPPLLHPVPVPIALHLIQIIAFHNHNVIPEQKTPSFPSASPSPSSGYPSIVDVLVIHHDFPSSMLYVKVQRMREIRLTRPVTDLDPGPFISTCDSARSFRYLQKRLNSVSVTPSISTVLPGAQSLDYRVSSGRYHIARTRCGAFGCGALALFFFSFWDPSSFLSFFSSHLTNCRQAPSIQFCHVMYDATDGLSLGYGIIPLTLVPTAILSITRSGGIPIGIGNALPSSIDAVVGDIYLDLEIICRCVTHRVISVRYEAVFMFAFVFVFRA